MSERRTNTEKLIYLETAIPDMQGDIKTILRILRGEEGADNGGGLIWQVKLNSRFRRYFWGFVALLVLSLIPQLQPLAAQIVGFFK